MDAAVRRTCDEGPNKGRKGADGIRHTRAGRPDRDRHRRGPEHRVGGSPPRARSLRGGSTACRHRPRRRRAHRQGDRAARAPSTGAGRRRDRRGIGEGSRGRSSRRLLGRARRPGQLGRERRRTNSTRYRRSWPGSMVAPSRANDRRNRNPWPIEAPEQPRLPGSTCRTATTVRRDDRRLWADRANKLRFGSTSE